jgi:TP901 family phage tail tape measure protein
MSNSAILGIGTKIEAGTKQAFTTIATGFKQIADAMSASATEMRKLGQGDPAKVFENAAKSITKLTAGLDSQIASTSKLTKSQEASAKAAQANLTAQERATAVVIQLNEKAIKNTDEYATAIQRLDIKYTDLLNGTDLYSTAANKMFISMAGNAKEAGVLEAALARLAAKQKEASQDSTAEEKKAKAISKLRALYVGLTTDTGKYGVQANKLMTNMVAYNLDIDKVSASLKLLKQRQRDAMQSDATVTKRAQDIEALRLRYAGLLTATSSYATQAKNQIATLNDYGNSVKGVQLKLEAMKIAQTAAFASDKQVAARALAIQNLRVKFAELAAVEGKYGDQARALLATTSKQSTNLKEVSVALAGVAKNQKALAATDAATGKRAEQIGVLTIRYKELLAASNKYGVEARELVANLSALGTSARVTAAELAKLNTSNTAMEKQAAAVQKLRKEYAELRSSQDRYGTAANKILANMKSHELAADKVAVALARLQKQQVLAEKSSFTFSGAIETVIGKLKSYAGYMVASTAVFTFISGVRSAISTAADYEQSLRDIQAIVRPTNEQLAEMSRTIKQVASDTKFSAIETAEGMKLLGQAGFEAGETIAAIPGVTNLATGTLTDMSVVVDLVSTSVKAFGLQASDTGKITDVFANAVNKSKLTIENIRVAMNYIGPAAHNAGMSLDETARIMMVLRNNGLKASTMATGFRQVLAKLVTPTLAFKKLVADAGMSMGDFSVESQGISTVLHNLRSVIKTNSDAFKSFGIRGSAVATALVKDADTFDAFASVVNRSGAAAEMAQIQLQGLSLMFKNLQDKVKNLWIALGDAGLVSVLKALVNIARVAVDTLVLLTNNGVVQLTIKMLLAVAASKALVAVFAQLKGAAAVTSVMTSISAGVSALAAVMTGGATATAGMTTAIAGLKTMAMSFAPTALVMGIGALIVALAGYQQKLKDTVVEQGVLSDQAATAATEVSNLAKKIEEGNIGQADQANSVDRLIDKYQSFGAELRNTNGDASELLKVLNDIKEFEEAKEKAATLASLEAQLMLLEKNKVAQQSWLTAIKDSIATDAAAAASKMKYADDINASIESIVTTAKKLGESDEAIAGRFSNMAYTGLLNPQQKEEIISRVTEVLDSLANSTKEGSLLIGEGITNGLVEGMDVDPIAAQAEEFNKSLESITFENSNKKIEKELTDMLLGLSVAEAKGVVTHSDAELAKMNATISAYDKMVLSALAYQEAANLNGTEEQQLAAATKVTDAIEKAQAVRLQKLEAYATKRQAIEDKITAQEDKSVEEQTKNDTKLLTAKEKRMTDTEAAETASATKVKEITSSAITKRIAQEEAFEAKKKELVEARVDIERSAAADIQSINDTLEDKILSIKMEGMTDEQKQGALASAANSRLEEGKKALAAASKKNDTEAIARAKELIESAGGYYEQLEDSDSAISGLKKVADATISAREAQEKVALADNAAKMSAEVKANASKLSQIDRDENTALTKAKERLSAKLLAINDVYSKATAAENTRHANEMANIAKEIAALKLKSDTISSQQDAVIASMGIESPTAGVAAVTDPSSPDFDWAQYEKDVGIAVSNGIESGTTAGVATVGESIKSAVATSVAEGAKQGIFDGVEVEGLPLEEWKAQGKKQGGVMASAMAEEVAEKLAEPDFNVFEDIDGKPISISINPATESELEPLIDSIKETLDKYPGEPTLDFTAAEALIKAFVIKAESKYKIEIPVTSSSTQAKAAGGQVYAMASGGKIPGTKSPKDKVNVLSRPGEWYINDEQASSWNKSVGSWFMNAVHKPMSQAGQYLKDSVLKGPSSRAVPVPVPTESAGSSSTDVLSSLQGFGTLNISIGGSTATVLASTASAASLAVMFKKIEDASSS